MIRMSTLFFLLFIIGIVLLVAFFVWCYKQEKGEKKKKYFTSFFLDFLFFDAGYIIALIFISFILYLYFKNK